MRIKVLYDFLQVADRRCPCDLGYEDKQWVITLYPTIELDVRHNGLGTRSGAEHSI
jgi:hypothetical protein